MEFLARVDPTTILIDPSRIRPSEWDLIAILDDLKIFVTFSRLIKATPVLELANGILRLINGEPFVRAAQETTPPLEEIVCLIRTDQATLGESFPFVPVSATDLLEERSEHDPYEAFELLSFVFPLTANAKTQIEQEIYSFFARVHDQPSAYGGSYMWLSALKWDEIDQRVSWVWKRNDEPGRHQQFFLDLLRHIDTGIACLRSWNGLALHVSS